MKVVTYGVAVLIVLVTALMVIRGLSGEDDWICRNGAWVAHGKPGAPKPTKRCDGGVQTKRGLMKLTSSVFSENEMIPKVFSCDGKNIHPPLSVSSVPVEAKSLVIIIDDPDAPAGTFTHWVVWNIPVISKEIIEGVIPAGAIEGINSAQKVGYIGPCPPSGTHHYIFNLFALDTMLALTAKADKSEIQSAISGHIIETAELTGLYHR